MGFNLPALLAPLRALTNPPLLLPHLTIPHFRDLPLPIFPHAQGGIRAVILDKDNCISTPHTLHTHPSCTANLSRLRAAFPGSSLVIVSNSAGSSSDPTGAEAEALEKATGVRVLRHREKKPACGAEVVQTLVREGVVEGAHQVVVVGDRLLTDVVMANSVGAYAVWVREGVVPERGVWTWAENRVYNGLTARGWAARTPGVEGKGEKA
ncbi:mitochondrial PGP phosphatase-domain-containing protein [Geopyxis carbonaria]|nr:mitochondrial PGP phosphatase-domain-containing protein [Geopyxis carbonaria]